MCRKIFLSLLAAGAGAVLLAGCGDGYGSSGGGSSAGTGFFITISSTGFSPLELAVPPGATVTVLNGDTTAHSVTSQAAPGDFTPGAVAGISFDTGPFTESATFTIPVDAQDGTVVPYYCSIHSGTMATPNGTIRIAAEAQPGGTPPGY